jgi:DNA polymerase-3 subunit alpha
MRIASALAGFSLGGADLLRKAMGKKDQAVMAEQRKKFVDGAVANSIPKAKAEKIYGLIEKFARYGFNKSHSAAYAMISVRTAFLKANYPAEFLAANMTSELDDSDRISILVDDARELGIEVVAPDINACDPEFKVVDGRIRYGLAAVKNVGVGAMKHVCGERDHEGQFKSLYDFCSRVSSRVVNKRVIESLIQVGAFDAFGHRAQLMSSLERIMEKAARSSRDAEKGQFSMFANDETYTDDALEACEEWIPQDRLSRERESLGFFLTGHPLDKFRDALQVLATMTTAELRESPNGKHAVVGGVVSQVKNTMDRKQQAMAFVTIEDRNGQAEGVIFADVLAKHKQLVVEDHVVLLEGKVSSRGGEGKLLVSSVQPVNEERPPESKEVHLSLDLDVFNDGELGKMKDLLSRHEGSAALYFHLKENGRKSCVVKSKSLSVRVDFDLLAELCGSIGAENIKLVRGTARIPS